MIGLEKEMLNRFKQIGIKQQGVGEQKGAAQKHAAGFTDMTLTIHYSPFTINNREWRTVNSNNEWYNAAVYSKRKVVSCKKDTKSN